MTREKLTVVDLLQGRDQVQRTNVFVATPEEAEAAELAGIDIITVDGRLLTPMFRAAAPTTFLIGGLAFGHLATADDYLRSACALYEIGADAFYCAAGLRTIEHLSDERLPVVGHVGLIPWHATWTGGFRAVGKTAQGARALSRAICELEDAGAFAAEIEVVPHAVARELAGRTSLFLISMGSGSGCHAQYLFAEDILGINKGRYPRHAKRYADLAHEHARLQELRVAAFEAFAGDVASGEFPSSANIVEIDEDELAAFCEVLDSRKSGTFSR
jgi:3-methyl-2-oxobutanoate hydroxymethyltransferase